MIGWLCNKIFEYAKDYRDRVLYAPEKEEVRASPGRRKGNGRSTVRLADCDQNDIDIPRTFRFDVSVGRGGVILITRRYDPKKDETVEIVNVIHDDQDIAHNIGQIVAMELLK